MFGIVSRLYKYYQDNKVKATIYLCIAILFLVAVYSDLNKTIKAYSQPGKAFTLAITLEKVEKVSKKGIVNKYAFVGYLYGHEITCGETIKVKTRMNGRAISLRAMAKEYGSKTVKGYDNVIIDFASLDLSKITNMYATVITGKNTHNWAKWRFKFKIRRIVTPAEAINALYYTAIGHKTTDKTSWFISILKWLTNQAWIFIIAGWVVIYKKDRKLQRNNKKQNLEIDTAMEMLEKLKLFNESMYNLMKEANIIESFLELRNQEKIIKLLISDNESYDNLGKAIDATTSCYADFHFYYHSRQIILLKCQDEMEEVDDLGFTTRTFLELLRTGLYIQKFDTENKEIPLEQWKNFINEAEETYKEFKDASIDLFKKLQNIYLAPLFDEKEVVNKTLRPPFYLAK